MQFIEPHIFNKGLDTTSDLRQVDNAAYANAQDVEHYYDEINTVGAVKPMLNTKFAYNIGTITPQNQKVKVEFVAAATYVFRILDTNNNILLIFAYVAATIGDLSTKIGAELTSIGISSSIVNNGSELIVEFTNQTNYVLQEIINAEVQTIYTIQEAFNYTADIEPLQSVYLNDDKFIFSKAVGHSYCEIGGARKDVNGTWSYVIIASSTSWAFPTDQVIDARIELRADSKLSLYWCENTTKPKAFYFPNNYYLTQNSAMRFASNFDLYTGNPIGQYTYDSIVEQSELQLLNNNATVEYLDQNVSGGALPAGTLRYAVRFGVNGSTNITPFSYLSGPIIVYSSPNIKGNIKGDITPKTTTKVNFLRITNAKPNIYNFMELAFVHYQGGGESATLIGRFDVPTEEFVISHTGSEIGQTPLDISAFPNVTPVIETSKSLEVKKNRLNLANVTLGTDEDLRSIAEAIIISQDSFDIGSDGNIAQVNNFPIFGVYQQETTQNVLPPFDTQRLIADVSTFDNYPTSYDTATGLYTVTVATQGGNAFSFSVNLSNADPGLSVDCTVRLTRQRGADVVDLFSAEIRVGDTFRYTTPTYNYIDQALAGDTYQIVVRNDHGIDMGAGINNFTTIITSASTLDYKSEMLGGEYYRPSRNANYIGYMIFETYAFFIRFHYKSGYITIPYYIRNYRIQPTDLTNGLTGSNRAVYSIHPVFSNIDISSIKHLINGFSIMRAICNPTIIATGIYIPAHLRAAEGFSVGYYAAIPYADTYGDIVPNGDTRRNFGAFLSPDINLGNAIDFAPNDVLYVLGQSTILTSQNDIQAPFNFYKGSYVEYLGNNINPVAYDILDAEFTTYGNIAPEYTTYGKYLNNTTLGQNDRLVLSANGQKMSMYANAYGITTDSPVIPNLGISPKDYGVYVASISRALTNQYDVRNVTVIDCHHFYNVTAETPDVLDNEHVFGGDTYTQKSGLRIVGNAFANTIGNYILSFITFYSQNRINQQMRHSTTGRVPLFPADCKTLADYLFTNSTLLENPVIDNGYKAGDNNINIAKPYNEHIAQQKHFWARIYYSQQKTTGSIYDSYRDIKPLDFKDIDAKNGEIVALYDANDTMIALQAKAVTKLPYQSDVLLKSDNGAEIYIGNGGVYAQREEIISTYGSSIKSATFVGQNKNGNRDLYWFSSYYKRILHYSYDGIKIISENAKMRNFLLKNTNYILKEFDIIFGFDVRRNNYWITSRCQNETIGGWDTEADYEAGQFSRVFDTTFLMGFEKLPDIYEAIAPNTGEFPPNNTTNWSLIAHIDNNYYNEWTLIYNETLNCFTTFSSILPKRYFMYKDELLIPRGIASYGRIYEIAKGTGVLKWLEQSGVFKQGKFILQPVINKLTEYTKSFLSIRINTGENNVTNPTINCATSTQNSIVTPNDYEQINSMISAAITPDDAGDSLQGEYMTASIETEYDITILDVNAKVYYRPRIVNK